MNEEIKCGILYAKLNGIDAITKIAKLRIIKWKDIISIANRASFFPFLLRGPCMKSSSYG
jgi:hypothetical protein